MSKEALRKIYKEKRKKLTPEEREEKSIEIANNILKLPVWSHKNYHLFLPIERFNEINTEYILQILFGKDKNVVVSRSDFETHIMHHYLLNENTTIKNNVWGIPEPQDGIPVADELIDVVFVPLLAFDVHGHRIGYGKGFYDLFLSKCKKETIKIGLSFFDAETFIPEISPSDIPLDYVATPNKIFYIKTS